MRKACKRIKRSTGHILLEPQVQKIVLPLHISLAMLPLGLFNRQHADGIAKVINIVFVDASGRDQVAHDAASSAGEVLCCMYKRVNEGKTWNTTKDEKTKLTAAIIAMDKYVRKITTNRLVIAAMTIDELNAEAKAKGYGFLDKAPVEKTK